MKDEIGRMRGMRQAALDARALIHVLDHAPRRGSTLSRAALLSWRIARLASARLRAHPNKAYQRDPSAAEAIGGGLRALWVGAIALQRKRPMRALQRELRSVARVVDDARALTLLPDLSDALGRSQIDLRQLLDEVAVRARAEGGARQEAHTVAIAAVEASEAPSPSPYLAL